MPWVELFTRDSDVAQSIRAHLPPDVSLRPGAPVGPPRQPSPMAVVVHAESYAEDALGLVLDACRRRGLASRVILVASYSRSTAVLFRYSNLGGVVWDDEMSAEMASALSAIMVTGARRWLRDELYSRFEADAILRRACEAAVC